MIDFIDYLKTYIKAQLEAQITFPTGFSLNVYDAYTIGHTPNKTEVQVQLMDYSEVERYSTFLGEKVSYLPVQVTVIGFQTKIGNTMKSAREVSMIVGEKVRNILSQLRNGEINANVKKGRVMTMTPALPLQDGDKSYMTAIRYEFWVANPYVAPVTPNQNVNNNQQSEQQ